MATRRRRRQNPSILNELLASGEWIPAEAVRVVKGALQIVSKPEKLASEVGRLLTNPRRRRRR